MSKVPKKTKRATKEENSMDVDDKPLTANSVSPFNRNKIIIDDDSEMRNENSIYKINYMTNQSNNKFLEDENILNIIKNKAKLPFKKPNWVSKYRVKEKNARTSKNLKNLLVDNLDTQTYNICKIKNKLDQSIEAGPSFLPKVKYCDVTGFETQYQDPRSGLRYYNSDIYKLSQNMTEPIKNQYLLIRKALFIIK